MYDEKIVLFVLDVILLRGLVLKHVVITTVKGYIIRYHCLSTELVIRPIKFTSVIREQEALKLM